MTTVTCLTCQHWTAVNNRYANGSCAKELIPEHAKVKHFCQWHKEHTYASRARLPHHALPNLPPTFTALRRPARAPAKQVSQRAVSGDRASDPARRTVRKMACAICGGAATETCKSCRKSLCGLHSYVHTVDGNNASITRHSGTVCFDCHPETLAKLSEAAATASRTRGVKTSPATESNCKEASPATGQ